MNQLFIEFCRKIKATPGLPDALRVAMIALALHYSDRGKSVLATRMLNFFGLRYAVDVKAYATERRVAATRFCNFGSIEAGIAAFLVRFQAAAPNWHMFIDSAEVLLAHYSQPGRVDWPKIRPLIPEARAILGSL